MNGSAKSTHPALQQFIQGFSLRWLLSFSMA